MKGLLAKEFYVLKKDYIIIYTSFTLLIIAMTNVISRHDRIETGCLLRNVECLFAPLAALTIGMITSSFKYDSKCEHMQYSLITPVTRREFTLSKILLLLLSSAAAGIWLFSVSVISCAVCGIEFTGSEAVRSAVIVLVMIVFAVYGGMMNIYYNIKKEGKGLAGVQILLFFIEFIVFYLFIMRIASVNTTGILFTVIFAALTVYYTVNSFRLSEEMEF